MSSDRTILALDVGDRRIGVALANLNARFASPLVTIDRQEHDNIFDTIMQLIEQYDARAVVVGLPRGMEGQETQQTTHVRQFADQLKKVCSLPIYLQDEAGTSLTAKEELAMSKKVYDKGDVDKLAATYILQDWLMSEEAKTF